MNYLANGGSLISQCQVIFKTTPIAMNIVSESWFYPPAAPKPLQYQSKIMKELYKSLPNDNIRMVCGYSDPTQITKSFL